MKQLLVFLLFVVAANVYAQNKNIVTGSVKGRLRDDEGNNSFSGATIMLLSTKDSSIAKTTIADDEGVFVLERLQVGQYKLYINYLGYEVIRHGVTVTQKDTVLDLGTVTMHRISITLSVVEVIHERSPMLVKNDTLEFDAGSFGTRENAAVEELLKRLPGIQVERDGTIKVNGEIVKKLLVDGKPFFADDPKMTTRNLSADMIDKVQFIDRKSKWSQFTRIDDGQREKTINLVIKRNRKGGYFGRVGGALAIEGHYAVNGNVNQFKDERQLAFWASGSNINGYRDNGGQSQISVGSNSDVHYLNAGGCYGQDFGKKAKISSNLSISKSNTEDRRSSERQNILPDTTWYFNQNSRVLDENARYALNTRVELMPDTLNLINISTDLGYSTDNGLQKNIYTSLGGRQQEVNSGNTYVTNVTSNPNVSIGIFWGKKFGKIGRTFSINLEGAFNNSEQERINKSYNLFVKPDGGRLIDSIDQRNNISNLSWSASLSLAYTEPLAKNYYLEFMYLYSKGYSTSNKLTYDYDHSDKEYNISNDSLSNFFENGSLIQQVGIKLLSQKEKYNYNLGLNIQFSELDNNNVSEGTQLSQYTKNFFPSATFSYYITTSKRIRFSYSGSTQQPSTAQLQPVPDNSNPLYIRLGDSQLKPSFNNTFNVSYTALNAVALRNFSAGMNYGFIANRIVNASWFDSLGRQVSQPKNVNGSFNISANVSTNIPLKKQRNSVVTGVSIKFSREIGFINEVKSEARSVSINPGINYSYSYLDIFGLVAAANMSYSRVKYTMKNRNNTWFLNYGISLETYTNLPIGVSVGGNLDYMGNAGKDGAYSGNIAMLNVYISKSFLKRKKGLVRLQGMDLLNRSIGINRTVETNYIEDVHTSVTQRYFLVSFSYFINKMRGQIK